MNWRRWLTVFQFFSHLKIVEVISDYDCQSNAFDQILRGEIRPPMKLDNGRQLSRMSSNAVAEKMFTEFGIIECCWTIWDGTVTSNKKMWLLPVR